MKQYRIAAADVMIPGFKRNKRIRLKRANVWKLEAKELRSLKMSEDVYIYFF